MNPNDKKPSDEPNVPMAPEDSPRLQEIEALEAREIDAHPKPFDPESLKARPHPAVQPQAPAPAPAPKPVQPKPVTPKVVEPVKPTKPIAQPTPAPAPKPVAPAPAKPTVKKTPAAAMAEELANAPPTKLYQFFHHQNGVTNRQRVAIVAGSCVALLVGLGILFYSFVQ